MASKRSSRRIFLKATEYLLLTGLTVAFLVSLAGTLANLTMRVIRLYWHWPYRTPQGVVAGQYAHVVWSEGGIGFEYVPYRVNLPASPNEDDLWYYSFVSDAATHEHRGLAVTDDIQLTGWSLGTENWKQPGMLLWALFGGQILGKKVHAYRASMPAWVVMLATGLWPLVHAAAIVANRIRRRRRRARGCCVHCGYDLRASEYRCPECGKPISTTEEPIRESSQLIGGAPKKGQKALMEQP